MPGLLGDLQPQHHVPLDAESQRLLRVLRRHLVDHHWRDHQRHDLDPVEGGRGRHVGDGSGSPAHLLERVGVTDLLAKLGLQDPPGALLGKLLFSVKYLFILLFALAGWILLSRGRRGW